VMNLVRQVHDGYRVPFLFLDILMFERMQLYMTHELIA
jgi:hypothetical protein